MGLTFPSPDRKSKVIVTNEYTDKQSQHTNSNILIGILLALRYQARDLHQIATQTSSGNREYTKIRFIKSILKETPSTYFAFHILSSEVFESEKGKGRIEKANFDAAAATSRW